MKILDDYFDLQDKIFRYFEYEEDWHIYPLDDRTEFPWYILDGCVYYALSDKNLNDPDELFCDVLIKGTKGVMAGKEYTAMLVDTATDDNKFLAIYKNDLRREPPEETLD